MLRSQADKNHKTGSEVCSNLMFVFPGKCQAKVQGEMNLPSGFLLMLVHLLFIHFGQTSEI
jgi:hypothetical protein